MATKLPGSDEAASSDSPSSQVAERTIDVLLCFVDAEQELGVSEIARRLSIEKGRVHRFLTALRRKGMVQQNPKTRRYSLGFKILELNYGLTRRLEVIASARPHLEQLRDASGETAGLTVRVGNFRVHVMQAESEQEIHQRFPVGEPIPLHVGAAGKALLSAIPAQDREAVLGQPLEPITGNTLTDVNRLREAVEEVERCGYATSCGERVRGSRSVASPVWSGRGDVMALVVSGPAERFTEDELQRLAPSLVDAADRLTRELDGLQYRPDRMPIDEASAS